MVMDLWRPPLFRPSAFDEMARFVDKPWWSAPSGRFVWRRVPAEEMAWAPSVEMYEKADSFIVRAELPGMNMDDVEISMLGDVLTIKGERKAPEDIKDEDYYRCEVCYGPFSRSITMPASVDAQHIKAEFENGILEVQLPKAKEAMPQKIEIKAKK